MYALVPRRQLAQSEAKGVVLPILFFLFLFFAQSYSKGSVPAGLEHTVIKREGGVTLTVHYRTQRVDWISASSPLGSWL